MLAYQMYVVYYQISLSNYIFTILLSCDYDLEFVQVVAVIMLRTLFLLFLLPYQKSSSIIIGFFAN